jgi:hypothetical protein
MDPSRYEVAGILLYAEADRFTVQYPSTMVVTTGAVLVLALLVLLQFVELRM